MEALKWIGIVVAAGFVGYFGRYLAVKIIERIEHRPKATPPPAAPASGTAPADLAHAKLAKKQAKQAAKTAKKTPRG